MNDYLMILYLMIDYINKVTDLRGIRWIKVTIGSLKILLDFFLLN
jgi:hypothetical protein